jgi:serine/threonine-protein kinase RsbW
MNRMRIAVRLNLPREVDSVPAVRRLLRCALSLFHVGRQDGEDLEIALTEACANVVKHASGAEGIEVRLDVDADHCTVDVVDNGPGFDTGAVGEPRPSSERGRGLFLIKALSDHVRVQSTPRSGSSIHFEKSFALAGGPGGR